MPTIRVQAADMHLQQQNMHVSRARRTARTQLTAYSRVQCLTDSSRSHCCCVQESVGFKWWLMPLALAPPCALPAGQMLIHPFI